jgi:hypothetical protein
MMIGGARPGFAPSQAAASEGAAAVALGSTVAAGAEQRDDVPPIALGIGVPRGSMVGAPAYAPAGDAALPWPWPQPREQQQQQQPHAPRSPRAHRRITSKPRRVPASAAAANPLPCLVAHYSGGGGTGGVGDRDSGSERAAGNGLPEYNDGQAAVATAAAAAPLAHLPMHAVGALWLPPFATFAAYPMASAAPRSPAVRAAPHAPLALWVSIDASVSMAFWGLDERC